MGSILPLVCLKMSKDEDMSKLFDLYALLQNLMSYHMQIDDRVKELAASPPSPNDFEPIKAAASAIISTCDEIEKCVKPQGCSNCCKLG